MSNPSSNQIILSGGWSELERRFLHSALIINYDFESEQVILTINQQSDQVPSHFNMHGAVRITF